MSQSFGKGYSVTQDNQLPHIVLAQGEQLTSIQPSFRFRLVVYAIEANHALEEDVQLGVRSWIFCHFEQRLEDVCGFNTSASGNAVLRWTRDILCTTSPKLSTVLLALKTSYNRGIWISHRTLSENSLLLTTHLASLSHSPRDLQNYMSVSLLSSASESDMLTNLP